jgi:ribosomal 50S subunit-recycling heat shock protein
MCDQGRVTLNGRVARASAEVKPGDQLELRLGYKQVSLRVETVPVGQVSTKMASELYRIEREERIPRAEEDDPPFAR